MRIDSPRLIISRLADIYCEMNEYSKAAEVLQPELNGIDVSDRQRRPFRRSLLASVEVNMGLGRLDLAASVLQELEDSVPAEPDNLHDQQLHMRRLLAAARVAHMEPGRCEEGLLRWRCALQEVERMHTLKSKGGFIAAMIYLSMAHAQLVTEDRDGARHSWATRLEILRSERCEFWIPVVLTVWLRWIAKEVHKLQGWSLRIMLPGGKSDITWP